MEKRLLFLHLEDEPNDVELVRETLVAEGVVCETVAVSDRETFLASLEQGGFDLILSDFMLPGYDGLSALEAARTNAPEVPFILVSGMMGEDAAIASLRSGATDYVLKQRLSRLGPAVRRALRESEERGRRRHAEEEASRSRDQALAAARLKSEFIDNTSHELRTPMGGILGMIELALETELTDEQRQYLEGVKSSAEDLLGVLDAILDFSALVDGRLELEPVPFRLRERLAEALEPLAARSKLKGLDLTSHVADDVPDNLVGDPRRLRQVLLHLAGNAVKFTERGAVMVRVSVDACSEDRAVLNFRVVDTGIGIPPEQQMFVFNAFVQADGSRTRRFGGTGLGLPIASQLVERMGGRIWVESEAGSGSTFHFNARFGLGNPPRTSPPAHPGPAPRPGPEP